MQYCHRVERLVEMLLLKFEIYSFWHKAGAMMLLSNPCGTQSLYIAYLEKHWVEIQYKGLNGRQAVAVAMTLTVKPGLWEVEDLEYANGLWGDYLAQATASSIPVFDETGMIIKASFVDVWADDLITCGWVRRSYLVDISLPGEEEAEPVPQMASHTKVEPLKANQGEGTQLSLFS